jgi:hypothetical protein
MADKDEHARLRGAARRAFDLAYNDAVTLPRFGRVLEETVRRREDQPRPAASAAGEAA